MKPGRGRVIGIDPGNAKCGYAVIGADGSRLALEVIALNDLPQRLARDVDESNVEAICIGHATNSGSVQELCRSRWPSIPVAIVDETNTTFEARRLYYEENPPRGLLRWLPRGLLVPDVALDGFAALLIIERWQAYRDALTPD